MDYAIPADVALRLCQEIRRDNRGKWYSFYGIWCAMCDRVSKGNVSKLCFSGGEGNRGCSQANRRWDNGD